VLENIYEANLLQPITAQRSTKTRKLLKLFTCNRGLKTFFYKVSVSLVVTCEIKHEIFRKTFISHVTTALV